MEIKKFILYYGLENDNIGVLPYIHGWEEGDVLSDPQDPRGILDKGKGIVYAIIWGTERNINALLDMFRELNTATSMKGVDYYFWDEYPYILEYMRCTKYTVKKRVYGDYKKRLDYMEEFVNNCIWE